MALNPANILHRQVIHTDSESGGESFRQQEWQSESRPN
jgi:hypothetical protein